MVATIDLGHRQRVEKIRTSFLRDQQSWIFLPDSVVMETSSDGTAWQLFGTSILPADSKEQGPAPYGVAVGVDPERKARYIRVTAKNLGDLPAWYGSKGQCWLFCDEIVVHGE
jgi:hypothetical protein